MSSRREFLTKSLGFIGVGIVGGTLLSKLNFDSSKGIEIGKAKANEFKDAIEVAGTCSYGSSCGGGGGSCSYGSSCGGGGGSCSYGSNCSGS